MADQLARTHPLEAWLPAFAELTGAVRIDAEPFVSMAVLRAARATTGDLRIRGTALPTAPNTWAPAGDGRLIWLGPDEWLLTSPGTAPEALEEELQTLLRPVGGSAADVSAQRISLRLGGPQARQVLAKGCSIDLHPRVFTAGQSTQTALGQAAVVLLALDEDEFAVLVRSSFAGYLASWLLDASLEHADPALTS
ncbi:sarcosine oxidase subunit gamma [Modestobacter sp. VKM Ac-2984]|uniref:sarcosine oxidase subunit gamma n=1 Tax=Modestobacter sp. VKM Ac-2984 TaxID=3004138 RepID=UPI0022AA9687|nr:sarcosine oxidase subunit gamma family protein [Modestobacter sp. VKM Ac-2984]MCZ2818117.1 sarcosine oxidase subunit gamma [Modestobacter sp. VKM Ac-2984]